DSGGQIELDQRSDRVDDAHHNTDDCPARRLAVSPIGNRGQDAGDDRTVDEEANWDHATDDAVEYAAHQQASGVPGSQRSNELLAEMERTDGVIVQDRGRKRVEAP